jgi:Transposase DDE domain group 1
LVDRIALAWVQAGYFNALAARTSTATTRQADELRRRQDAAARRLLTAVRSLTLLRRHLPRASGEGAEASKESVPAELLRPALSLFGGDVPEDEEDLFALAYNLANSLRQLALPRSVRSWSLTTLREKLVKIGAKEVTHARYVVFQLAEVAVPRQLFAQLLERIARLCPARCRVEVGRAGPAGRRSSPCVRGASPEPLAETGERGSGSCSGLSPRRGESRRHVVGGILAIAPSGG